MDAKHPLPSPPPAPHHASHLGSLGEPRLLISRRALLHNARVVRRQLAPHVRVCAIVKADAYGHGAAAVADTLCNFTDDLSAVDPRPAADALAVASLDEAAAVSDVLSRGPDDAGAAEVPVIVLRPVENAFVGRQRARLEEAVRAGWTLTLCSPAAADDLARIAQAAGRRAGVQVMVDTGMTRSGVAPHRLPDLLHKIDARPSLRLAGLCTHFASGEDAAGAFTAEQLARFDEATHEVATPAKGRVMRHAANSGATFFAPASHLDMVRPGISLYGIDPTGKPSLDRPLRPAMKWTAPLVGVQDIAAGVAVGYGQGWRAARRSRIGLVPVGYADGYRRCFGGRASVLVLGQAVPVVGRVSMDLTTVDLTDVPHAAVGDEVTLLDNDPLSPVSVYYLARWADTIPYDILCTIGPRVRRVMVDPE